MPKTAIHHAMIASWERPEEELRFLKETLKDKDWRAEIIFPANQPAAQLQSQRMQRTLEDQGYLVNSILTDKGETILKIHHLGVDSKLRDIARETSLSGTLTQMARHPLIPLRNTLQSAQNAIDKLDDVVKDPAQANGLIFTVAEAFLTLAGLGNKSGQKESFWTKIKQPRNYLQSLAGGLYLGQSITYLTLAKSNDQRSFEQLKDEATLVDFFANYFPDTKEVIPDLVRDFFKNPTSYLAIMKCYPWTFEDKVALIGDASHAIVPFYGHGMNAGFEDITVLSEMISKYGDDWKTIFSEYQKSRKPNADAIAELSLRNFIEMSTKTADEKFLLQKKIEKWFSDKHPDKWMPLYSRVTFSLQPYAEALAIGDLQNKIMEEVMQMPDIEANWNSEEVEKKIIDLLK